MTFMQLQWTWAEAADAPIADAKPVLSSAQLYKRWKQHEQLAEQFFELYKAAVGEDKAKLAAYSASAVEPSRRKPRVTKKQAAKRKGKARAKSSARGRK